MTVDIVLEYYDFRAILLTLSTYKENIPYVMYITVWRHQPWILVFTILGFPEVEVKSILFKTLCSLDTWSGRYMMNMIWKPPPWELTLIVQEGAM